MTEATQTFLTDTGARVPLICGAMYPCSNPELLSAVAQAGAVAVIQPISLTYVHGRDYRQGLRELRQATDGALGLNALVEKTTRVYEQRVERWVDIALEEGIRFFVTALGNPRWVVEKAHAAGAKVYHDVTERRWADKALDHGVDGLICVNRRAGGHTGVLDPRQLYEQLVDLGVPLVAAGGIGSPGEYRDVLDMGYAAAQLGTRFIATEECTAHDDYKQAILDSAEQDIVLTDKLSGVPCSVIATPSVLKMGLESTGLARRLLRGRRTKRWMRSWYALRSLTRLKRASLKGVSYKDVWQAGKSVATIERIEPVAALVDRFAQALRLPG